MLAVLDQSFTSILDAHFDKDLLRSAPVDGTRRHDRPALERVQEVATAPIRRFV
ncbi:hypothetical protein ACIP98_29750 [Streptomyces sp. NPDC088354]|uniref:hypothetical protein n=1 Tax=Streptomyces sp. NPDC088354 TaxID=3365856 RepID=UPI00381BFA21